VKSLGVYRPEQHSQYLAEAARARQALAEGHSPHTAISRPSGGKSNTFAAWAEAYIAAKITPRLHTEGSVKNVNATIACIKESTTVLGDLEITAIKDDDIIRALGADKPGGYWFKHPPAARKRLRRITWVIDYGLAKSGMSHVANPADWKRLKRVITEHEHYGENHPSVPPANVPAVFRELSATTRSGYRGWAPLALRFAILTVTRGNEVMKMRWDDITWRTNSWDRGKKNMKARLRHRVPLSQAALAMLRELEPFRGSNPYVFQGQKPNTGLSHNSLRTAMQKTSFGELATPHGFRTSFVDWWLDGEGWNHEFTRDDIDLCLAHAEDEVRAAYRNNDILEKRRRLLERWGKYVTGTEAAPVIAVAA
jgi:integrase